MYNHSTSIIHIMLITIILTHAYCLYDFYDANETRTHVSEPMQRLLTPALALSNAPRGNGIDGKGSQKKPGFLEPC